MVDILVTGASGFLGRHVSDELIRNGFRVIAPVRNLAQSSRAVSIKSPSVASGIVFWQIPPSGSKEVWAEFPEVKGIVHAATHYGRLGSDLRKVLEANLAFPIELIEGGLSSGVEFVINVDTFLSAQENKGGPLQNYIASKKALMFWLNSFSESLKTYTLRIEHMYGPDDHLSKFVPWVVGKIAHEQVEELELTQGNQTRDFVHVSDVARAIVALVRHEHELLMAGKTHAGMEDFSIGTGVSTPVKDVPDLVKRLSRSKTLLKFGAISQNKVEPLNSVSDKRFQKKFGWEPRIELEQGLREMLEVSGGGTELGANHQVFQGAFPESHNLFRSKDSL